MKIGFVIVIEKPQRTNERTNKHDRSQYLLTEYLITIIMLLLLFVYILILPLQYSGEQAVVRKHNKPRPRLAHRGIARFLGIEPKLNQVVPWSLHTFPENFMQIGPAVFS